MHVISRPSANAADPFEATRLHGCNVQGCKAQVAGCRLRLQANVTRRLQDGGVHGSRRRLMDARLQAARRKVGGSRWLQHARLRRTGCRLQSCKLQSCKGTGSKVAGSHNSLHQNQLRDFKIASTCQIRQITIPTTLFVFLFVRSLKHAWGPTCLSWISRLREDSGCKSTAAFFLISSTTQTCRRWWHPLYRGATSAT